MTSLAHITSGTLAYEVRGRTDLPPLLLLRPLGGSMALWGAFADRLATERRVIMFDPRGAGRSSKPPWSITTRAMAADAASLLDTLGVETTDVFGLSLGGLVATWLAIDAPHRVRRLILASTLPRPSAVSRRVARRIPMRVSAMFRRSPNAEVALVRQTLSSVFREREPARVAEIEALIRAHPAGSRDLMKLALAAARHCAVDRLSEITAPTLLLVGDLDLIVSDKAQEELLRLIPTARLERIEGAGHDLSLEQPIATAVRCLGFLGAA